MPRRRSRVPPVGKARQRIKRPRLGRRFLDFENRARAARKNRQGEGEFLGDGLADIDEITGKGLERYIVVGALFGFGLG
jgi:hypothetical protein